MTEPKPGTDFQTQEESDGGKNQGNMWQWGLECCEANEYNRGSRVIKVWIMYCMRRCAAWGKLDQRFVAIGKAWKPTFETVNEVSNSTSS